ncbi:hypothetical protein GOODEAATRI_017850 [Goodea atripinnis]|uniref:Uncharacterized protein n=1 Tax=Goodea atripinnis TaxID=208336 RepID=A0ABV0N5K1_9TELE
MHFPRKHMVCKTVNGIDEELPLPVYLLGLLLCLLRSPYHLHEQTQNPPYKFFLFSETVFGLFFNLLTEGFFFTDTWCSFIILTITGLELSSEGLMEDLHRLLLTSFHF